MRKFVYKSILSIVSVILSVSIISSVVIGTSCVFANAEQAFLMPTFLSDGMLFERNKPMNIWGKASEGSIVKAELYYTQENKIIETKQVTTSNTEEWEISFNARSASYDNYYINIYVNGELKKTINDILVGVLWLAAGQSNMEYVLPWAVGGLEMIEKAKNNPNEQYLRILSMPNNPCSGNYPSTPNFDVKNCKWGNGCDESILKSVSAMAYIAAETMRKELNIPVGIINAAMGGTSIQTWLSREYIENDSTIVSSLKKSKLYLTSDQYTTESRDFNAMTALYNGKIAPLGKMNISGMLWCQGEGNVGGYPNDKNYFRQCLIALEDNYSELFGFEKGKMPLILSEIANHPYFNDSQCIPKWIEEVSYVAQNNSYIVNIPIYDASQEYEDPPESYYANSIHPNDKTLPGTRMGLAALCNVYGVFGNKDYYAPTVKEWKVEGNKIVVKFNNVVEGLTTLNTTNYVHGFTITDENGKYAPATALITSKDTVEIYNDGIKNPTNFMYAFNSYSVSCNLCNSYYLPAVAYRSNSSVSQTAYFCNNDWMYCDGRLVWINNGSTGSYEKTWENADNIDNSSKISLDATIKCEGKASIKLQYDGINKSAGALVNVNKFLMPLNLQNFKYISFMVCNNDTRQKNVKLAIEINGDSKRYYLNALSTTNTDGVSNIVGNTGEKWNRVVYSTNTAKDSSDKEYTITKNQLTNITKLYVIVEDDQEGFIFIDDFSCGIDNPGTCVMDNAQMFGDIDNDKSVSAADALTVLQCAVGKKSLSLYEKGLSDVNGDKTVNASDALLVLQRSVMKITKFEVEKFV